MNLILIILLDIIPLINAALTELPETCNGHTFLVASLMEYIFPRV